MSEILENVSHDSVNRFLLRERYEPKDLFASVKEIINLEGGILSVDDTVVEKICSDNRLSLPLNPLRAVFMLWLKYKAWISDWLMHPFSVIPVLLLGVVLTWILTRHRWRWILTPMVALPLLCYGLTFLPPVVALGDWGLTHWIPADTGESADAIVLLGRGEILGFTRVLTAVDLWSQGRAPLVFASGNGDGPSMERWLLAKGIPKVQSEGCSRTTEENAQYTAALLQPQGINRIILVTDPPHLFRSWLTFQSLGFTVIPYASPPWPDKKKWVFPIDMIREYLALISYGILGRFHSRPYTSLENLLQARPVPCDQISLQSRDLLILGDLKK